MNTWLLAAAAAANKAAAKKGEAAPGGPDWQLYALIALGALVIVLFIVRIAMKKKAPGAGGEAGGQGE